MKSIGNHLAARIDYGNDGIEEDDWLQETHDAGGRFTILSASGLFCGQVVGGSGAGKSPGPGPLSRHPLQYMGPCTAAA